MNKSTYRHARPSRYHGRGGYVGGPVGYGRSSIGNMNGRNRS